MIDPKFWLGKRVLLTGHTGFKGAWLAAWLDKMGAQVHGFSLPPSSTTGIYAGAAITSRVSETLADIREPNLLHNSVVGFQPQIIFHLAAQPLVKYSYEHPIETFETNIMGTVRLLGSTQFCRELMAVVIVTTDKCYQNQELTSGYTESAPLGGHDPYSSSKACVELICNSWYQSYVQRTVQNGSRFGLGTARAGNVIGGGDMAADRLVPDVLRAVEGCQPVHIRKPDAVRPWQYILDPLAGYLCLAQALAENPTLYSGPWNFGPDLAGMKSVQWIVETLLAKLTTNSNWIFSPDLSTHETRNLLLDCSKAKTKLGWLPQYDLEAAIEAIARWQERRTGFASHSDLVDSEFDAYMRKLAEVKHDG